MRFESKNRLVTATALTLSAVGITSYFGSDRTKMPGFAASFLRTTDWKQVQNSSGPIDFDGTGGTVGGGINLIDSNISIEKIVRSGRVSVVESWGYWCPACRTLESQSKTLMAKYGDRIQFISVTPNTTEQVLKNEQGKNPLPNILLTDASSFITKNQMQIYPTLAIYTYDTSGNITQLYRTDRVYLDHQEIINQLDKALASSVLPELDKEVTFLAKDTILTDGPALDIARLSLPKSPNPTFSEIWPAYKRNYTENLQTIAKLGDLEGVRAEREELITNRRTTVVYLLDRMFREKDVPLQEQFAAFDFCFKVAVTDPDASVRERISGMIVTNMIVARTTNDRSTIRFYQDQFDCFAKSQGKALPQTMDSLIASESDGLVLKNLLAIGYLTSLTGMFAEHTDSPTFTAFQKHYALKQQNLRLAQEEYPLYTSVIEPQQDLSLLKKFWLFSEIVQAALVTDGPVSDDVKMVIKFYCDEFLYSGAFAKETLPTELKTANTQMLASWLMGLKQSDDWGLKDKVCEALLATELQTLPAPVQNSLLEISSKMIDPSLYPGASSALAILLGRNR